MRLILPALALGLAGCGAQGPSYSYCAIVSAPEADGRMLQSAFDGFAAENGLSGGGNGPVHAYQSADARTEIFMSVSGGETKIAVRPLNSAPDVELADRVSAFVENTIAPRWEISACPDDAP